MTERDDIRTHLGMYAAAWENMQGHSKVIYGLHTESYQGNLTTDDLMEAVVQITRLEKALLSLGVHQNSVDAIRTNQPPVPS